MRGVIVSAEKSSLWGGLRLPDLEAAGAHCCVTGGVTSLCRPPLSTPAGLPLL